MSEENGFVYNSGNYEKYTSKNPLKRKMVENLNRKVLTLLDEKVEKQETVLDAGCGEGFITSLIAAKLPDTKVTGIEYTAEAIAIAKKQFPGIDFIQGDIMNLDIQTDSVDYVVCTEVLEHLTDPVKALQELYRIARKGILITVPNEPWFCMGNLVALKNVSRLGNPIDHINHWTHRKFKSFVCTQVEPKRCTFSKSFPWSICFIVKK